MSFCHDLLAYDSTCAGISACVAAARRGLRAVLVTEEGQCGRQANQRAGVRFPAHRAGRGNRP
jgi:alkyl hydroperoxide reductase subunit AhpF